MRERRLDDERRKGDGFDQLEPAYSIELKKRVADKLRIKRSERQQYQDADELNKQFSLDKAPLKLIERMKATRLERQQNQSEDELNKQYPLAGTYIDGQRISTTSLKRKHSDNEIDNSIQHHNKQSRTQLSDVLNNSNPKFEDIFISVDVGEEEDTTVQDFSSVMHLVQRRSDEYERLKLRNKWVFVDTITWLKNCANNGWKTTAGDKVTDNQVKEIMDKLIDMTLYYYNKIETR